MRPSSSSLIGSKLDAARPTVVLEREEPASGKQMKPIRVGSRVRIADRVILHAALHSPHERRPEPAQMVWAGRDASVTGYRRGAGNRSLYVLRGTPALWAEEWDRIPS
jgi:hypothetical protein